MTAVKLSAIPKLSQLSPLVTRILGCNPGKMTLQGTNTYLVGNGKRRLLVDTGESSKPEYIENLRKFIEEHELILDSVICTHWHRDHVGGVDDICEVLPVKRKDVFKHKRTEDVKEDGEFNYVHDGHVFRVEGASLKAIHTPGHTTDHIVLQLVEENSVFSGDCILGEGTAVFEDLYNYMNSLHKILHLKPTRIYPGHGKLIEDPIEKINYYISHRNERESQIYDCIVKSGPGEALSAMDIVKNVYKDTPEQLYRPAALNVGHHLKKLVKEGKIHEVTSEGGQERRFQMTP